MYHNIQFIRYTPMYWTIHEHLRYKTFCFVSYDTDNYTPQYMQPHFSQVIFLNPIILLSPTSLSLSSNSPSSLTIMFFLSWSLPLLSSPSLFSISPFSLSISLFFFPFSISPFPNRWLLGFNGAVSVVELN